MRATSLLTAILAVIVATTSSAVKLDNPNGYSQEKGTRAPSQATTSGSTGTGASLLRSSNSRSIGAGLEQQEGSSYMGTSGSDEIAYVSVWGAPVVAHTSSNHSAAVPTFGKITSKAGECVVAEPTEYISKDYLNWVWQHRIGPNSDTSSKSNWNVMDNKNWIMDHLVHNNGSLNYCWLEGYNCWPFTKLGINMVGWATKDKTQFEWSDESMGTVYEGILDPTNGVPQCPDECYRFYDNVNDQWSDTSNCKGEPFDVSLWLKEDIPYGFGYDWGEEISLNNTLQNLYDKNLLFFAHEIGHGFGLPDFYGLEDKPATDFPNCVMMAYSAITVTPGDGWMLRRVLDHVRDRYNF
ncbi:hypothetical protein AM587_10009676 [Phytophthora nicotianae]|uniref:Neutral zinc metallopeptidase n=1 Tax=Phytophthora nicotianae TaxID=4792 RepID=A0A0W8CKB6_PHYNI|nr:hypothetical protein AM587_10009676 [Phytophthora nicotianae]KUF89925.1 hypothetical protein AM588_10006333 [Phytophthora nicotianae]